MTRKPSFAGAALLAFAIAGADPGPGYAALASSDMARDGADATEGRWALEIAPGECRLTHRVVRPRPAELTVRTQTGTDRYVLSIAEQQSRRVAQTPFHAQFRVDGKLQARTFGVYAPADPPYLHRLVITSLDGGAIDAIGKGSEISIRNGRREAARLPIRNSAQAVEALRRCEAEQLIEWGADPAQFEPGGVQPRVGDRFDLVPQSLLERIQYPQGPINPLHYLVLSEEGVVEQCKAVFGIPNSDFEQVVCAHLTGRRIGEPARDPRGEPVRGVIALSPGRLVTAPL